MRGGAAFRSKPGATGFWPHVLGAVLALVLPSLLGLALMLGIGAIVTPPPARSAIPAALQPWLATFVASPALTWMALVPGIPFAVSAARRGQAGWARLAFGGGVLVLLVAMVVGGLLRAAWTSALGPGGEGSSALGGLDGALSFFVTGACAGFSYWMGLRLAAAHLFAVHRGTAENARSRPGSPAS